MSSVMTPDRFQDLADIYGADLRRWPEAERDAGRALLAARPELNAVLHDAAALDDALDAFRVAAPSMALRDRVIAQAATKARPARRGWLDRLQIALGAGWAAAACAGVAAGIVMSGHWSADAQADAVLYQASLSGLDDVEVLG